MSGQDILIEQSRAEVERLRDDRADLQERCNRLTGERNAALLLMKDEEARAEKAERFPQPTDSEWKARAEKAERERDEALRRRTRAERVGRAVLLSFGYAPFTYYKWADALERHTLETPARLLRAISDALKEADDAE